jgi:putative endonuclease
MWQIYILLCDNTFLYTGLTSNLKHRLKQHQNHLTQTTKRFSDIKLIHTENFDNKFDAAKREHEIKSWNRQKKLSLVNLG